MDGDRGESEGEAIGELEGMPGFCVISSSRVLADARCASDFNATAASPRVASLRSVDVVGDGVRSIRAIKLSKALRASSMFPVSSEARPYR